MRKIDRRLPWLIGTAGLGLAVLLVQPAPVSGFTQSGVGGFFGNLIPMGHEWITRMAGMELLGGDSVIPPDPNDPRKHWTKGLAKDPDISNAQNEVKHIKDHKVSDSRYASTYEAVFAAIIGERWVDIAGFNVTKAQLGKYNCFDNVSQEPVDIQYDHCMRRYDDRAGAGGVDAAQRSRERLVNYFVTAATAPRGIITVWDGGGYSALVTVDRNYFLFGRAVHLFEDSFSSEHTVRLDSDNYVKMRQVKSYLCAAGSEQHTHSQKAVLDYTSGDVVWKPGTRFDGHGSWSGYKASNMKTVALVGTEGMKDMWAAFIRVMNKDDKDRADAARKEANRLIDNWLAFDKDEMTSWYNDESHRDATYVLAPGQSGKGQTVEACMKGLGSQTQEQRAKEIEDTRRICLYNVIPTLGFADAVDPELKMPYNWQWRSSSWQMPPAGWQIPDVKVPPEIKVTIKSVKAKDDMVAPDGIANNNWIYVKDGEPLKWVVVGDRNHAIFRLADAPLFLSYRLTTGAVKLYNTATDAEYKIGEKDDKDTIFNLRYNDYMWLDGKSPYVSGKGDPKKDNAQWQIEGLPDKW